MYRYWVALISQSLVDHQVHTFDGRSIKISSPALTQTYPRQQPSYETVSPHPLNTWGESVRVPLGYVVHGRSGDKSSDCNVGFFARDDEEWDWLRSALTVPKIRELLGDEDKGERIDRFEMRHLRAVHFLLKDHLDRGVNSTSSYDCLGKNACEYLRARPIEVPKKFLDKGKI